MITDAKLKHDNIIDNVKVSLGLDTVFLFTNSLPKNVVPKIGDEIILDFEDSHLLINSIVPLITGKMDWDNYALKVEAL